MLVGFTCENYASYRDRSVFSMEASSTHEYAETHVFSTEHGRLLKSAIIYGANGAGKSNLFKALWFMRRMVVASIYERDLPRQGEYFRFFDNGDEVPSLFEASFIVHNILYRYGFSIIKGQVQCEWLYRKAKRESLLFERKGPAWETIELKGPLRASESIRKHTREDSLFITAAALLNDPISQEVVRWFESILLVTPAPSVGETVEYITESEENRQRILKYLQKADTGISEFSFSVSDEKASEEQINLENTEFPPVTRVRKSVRFDITTSHAVFDELKTQVSTMELPFLKYQSKGTIKLFEMLGPILRALEEGRPVLIDELGARLHPNLVRFVLSLFNSLDDNSHNSQLICNTHDVLLLEEDIRRDQVWFVQKNAFGESELYSLHDFADTRQRDLFLRKYLLGVFGAVPRLGAVPNE